MELNEILDQLYAELHASNILVTRLWGYLALASGDRDGFLAKQRNMSLESVDAWKIEGGGNPERIKNMARAAVNRAFDSLIFGAPSKSQIQ